MFELLGDISRILSVLFLIYRIEIIKNIHGISVETQELYLLVFLTRYLDIFTSYTYVNFEFLRKLFLLTSTGFIMFRLYERQGRRTGTDTHSDFFSSMVLPCLPMAAVTVFYESKPFQPSVMEFFYTFSIYLEALALFPQLHQLYQLSSLPHHSTYTHTYSSIPIHGESESSNKMFSTQEHLHSHSHSTNNQTIRVYIHLILLYRTFFLLRWLGIWVFPECANDNHNHDASILSIFFPCSQKELMNIHFLVIHICGLVQTLSILIFFACTTSSFQEWRERRRGATI